MQRNFPSEISHKNLILLCYILLYFEAVDGKDERGPVIWLKMWTTVRRREHGKKVRTL